MLYIHYLLVVIRLFVSLDNAFFPFIRSFLCFVSFFVSSFCLTESIFTLLYQVFTFFTSLRLLSSLKAFLCFACDDKTFLFLLTSFLTFHRWSFRLINCSMIHGFILFDLSFLWCLKFHFIICIKLLNW